MKYVKPDMEIEGSTVTDFTDPSVPTTPIGPGFYE